MKTQIATGFIPYEIGDIVKLKKGSNLYTIKQIRMIQYIPSGKVEFEVQIHYEEENILLWKKPDVIEKRITK